VEAEPAGAVAVGRDEPFSNPEAECVFADAEVCGGVLGIQPGGKHGPGERLRQQGRKLRLDARLDPVVESAERKFRQGCGERIVARVHHSSWRDAFVSQLTSTQQAWSRSVMRPQVMHVGSRRLTAVGVGVRVLFRVSAGEVQTCSERLELGTERQLAELVVPEQFFLERSEVVRIAVPLARIERLRWSGRLVHVVSLSLLTRVVKLPR
jgi:hypothetical protein